MKKALVMTVVLVLGLGFAASAVSLAGEWSGTVEFDPGAVAFADFLTDFSSDLSVTYSIGSLSVTSETGFDSLGYASQAFSAEVTLGAFIFASEMSFLPRAVLTETITYDYTGSIYDDFDYGWWGWPPLFRLQTASVPQLLSTVVLGDLTPVETFGVAFDEWTTEASISLAGVNLGALFYMKDFVGTVSTEVIPIYSYEWATVQTPPSVLIVPPITLTDSGNPVPWLWWNWWEYAVQTATYVVDNSDLVNRGAGWRFMISGELSPVRITSYTYFNLIEGFAMDDDPDTKSFDRNGDFEIAVADQVVRFTEEYIVIEGLSLGCIEADVALRITCDNGFEYFSLWFKDIYLLCCGISTDFEIDFSLTEKTVELFPEITVDWVCWEPTLTLNWADNGITGITLDALTVEVALNGLTFSATTVWDGSMDPLDSGTTEDWYFFVPAVAGTAANPLLRIPSVIATGFGNYEIQHVSFANDYYELFESFTITYEGDSCCGGLFAITVETLFGDHMNETLLDWGYWYETNMIVAWAPPVGAFADHGLGLYWDRLGTYGAAGWSFYYYDWLVTSTPWYPGCGVIPWTPVDAAYAALLGLGGAAPFVYAVPAVAEEVLCNNPNPVTGAPENFTTLVTDVAGGTLFGWAQTNVDVSLGIGSSFTLEFGLDVGAYGWTRASFGFTFSF